MDSVTTVIRFRQGPPEVDITSVTISIVLDVFTGYIVKNGSGWWCTWVWEGGGGGGGGGGQYIILQLLGYNSEEWEWVVVYLCLGLGEGGGSVVPYRGLLSWVEICMQNIFHGDSSVVSSSYM